MKAFIIMMLVCAPVSWGATASWYDSESVVREGTCKSELCYTASGKEIHALEKAEKNFAASNRFKIGTRVRVCAKGTGKCTDVQILDRGGFGKYGREIDLCKRAFAEIAPLRQGTVKVTITKIK